MIACLFQIQLVFFMSMSRFVIFLLNWVSFNPHLTFFPRPHYTPHRAFLLSLSLTPDPQGYTATPATRCHKPICKIIRIVTQFEPPPPKKKRKRKKKCDSPSGYANMIKSHIHTYTYAHMCTRAHTHTNTTHTCPHTYIHTYMCMHVHI